ncbi:MAG: WbqC family protein, partial [Candidatus Hermodarchaeia archaeon]
MKLAIMQPYFFPYIGYFHLAHAADMFVVYDNIQYTKRGWINRNRILHNGTDTVISLPLKRDSDYLDVRDRVIAESFNRKKLLNRIRGAYNRAPHFKRTFSFVESIINYDDHNLFRFLLNSMVLTFQHLGIDTAVVTSSDVSIDHRLKSQDKVLAMCEAVDAQVYINAIGGIDLYSREAFSDRGIELKFVKSKLVEYKQFGQDFCPWLSIIDVMMFNDMDTIKEYLDT